MKKHKKWGVVFSAAGLTVAGIGLATTVVADGFTNVEAPASGLNERFQRYGAAVPIASLQRVGDGTGKLTKQDVTELLGIPNDSLAIEQDNSWQYNVNLPLNDEDYLVCQYQVSFSQQVLASSEWRRPQCNQLFSELSEHAQPQVISFSADFLFGFDSYAIFSQGRRELQQAVQDAQARLGARSVLVTGHTDQIGSAKYNMWLSEKRAQAVADVLVQGGVNPEQVIYVGRGENDSVVSCPDLAGASLKECLAPNRRVEVLFNRNT